MDSLNFDVYFFLDSSEFTLIKMISNSHVLSHNTVQHTFMWDYLFFFLSEDRLKCQIYFIVRFMNKVQLTEERLSLIFVIPFV